MKTTVNNIRFMMLLAFVAITMTALAQNIANIEKMSISTQMFLDQMEGKADFYALPAPTRSGHKVAEGVSLQPRIAKPDTINGQLYISSFVRVTDDSVIDQLKDLGVIIECQFKEGLMTTYIPVDRITEVAGIAGVREIEVASVLRPLTDKAREATNVDDVLTNSADAIAAGLNDVYDGTGVILGIIDIGIDFNHIAFKDKNGNSRIKGLLCYTNTDNYQAQPAYEWTGSGTIPNYDVNDEDHGTHTSSTAGGSSVIINGSNVTVTDDHSNATYGGMAPGTDLYLAGVGVLYNTRTAYALKKISDFATAQNKPLVVSNSWGSHNGPHDGTGYLADVVRQNYGDDHPNHICLFASSNDAGNANYGGEGGGYHVMGAASSANPLRTIVRSHYYSDTDDGYLYYGTIANAWCRDQNVSMTCKIHVIDRNTRTVIKTVTANPSANGTIISALSDYYSGTLKAYSSTSNSKTQIRIDVTSSTLETTSYSGSYVSDYTLAIEFYPNSGEHVIDVWAGEISYFNDFLTVNGYNWTCGSDDMTASDQSTIHEAISIGAYVTKNQITDYNGTTHSYASTFTMGDIAYFSSYATADQSPTGERYPWVAAPGARLVAAVNHHHTTDNYNYINGQYGKTDRVNANTTYPYGAMQGTSMACPTAAGIVALWLQAAQEVGKTMTTSDIKDVMRETAIIDQFTTTGPNASHFGNGKIDALAGIQYILGGNTPTISAIPTEVTFDGEPGNSYTSTVSVRGRKLTGDIIATLNDNSGVYSINPTNLGNGGELTITFAPNEEGEYSATITLTSPGAEPVTITINGIALIHTSTLTSNVIAVPVYQSEAEVNYSTYIFSEGEVIGDVNMNLAYPSGAAPGEVKVLAKNDEHILNYELHHKVGNGNWTYPNGNAVATANHVGNSYVVNDNTFTFPQDATEMWITMNDSQLNTAMTTYYIPVTVAKSIVENGSQDNTYGAPVVVSTSDGIDLEVSIGGYKSASKDKYGNYTGIWEGPNGINYCVYMPQVHVVCQQLGALRPYMYRAWLLPNDDITYYNFAHHPQTGFYGTTPITDLPKLLAESSIEDVSNPTHVLLPEELGDTYEGMNTFGAPVNILDATDNPNNPGIVIAVRVYYQSADEENGHMLRGNRDGGYGFGEGHGSGNGIPTGVNELFGFGKQVVDVQYVNALGMQSREPFDGLNIVVTRYNDGSITTTKVVK